MLKLGESRDATAMFEAHHPFTSRKRLQEILAKHEVPASHPDCVLLDERDAEETFEWPDSGDGHAPVSEFARELRSQVVEQCVVHPT